MSFLVIGGIPCLVLADNSATEQAREYGGSLRRAWDGTLRNTTRYRKRQWAFTIAPMIQTDYDAIDAITLLRQIVACSGAALGASINCAVTLQAGSFIAAHNQAQSAPLFYSLTIGDGSWASAHNARVAGNFVCNDGIALDLLTDNSAGLTYSSDTKAIVLASADPKIVRFRVARSGATIAGLSIFDSTAQVHRVLAQIDFTNVVPVVTGLAGQLLSMVDRTDGSYEITMQTTAGIVPANVHTVIVYPALPSTASVGSINIGNLSVWDDASGNVGFRRTMAVTLQEA